MKARITWTMPLLCCGAPSMSSAKNASRPDSRDTRQLNVTLTQLGRDYALAIVEVISELNREVAGRVSPAQLAAADAVLRAALFDDSARQRASRLPPPPG
jgi:hypothetical protein